ncbi:MBL fold metallo-hydrolase [Candidatus Poribacteria bacterium]|nr:MBL fold metallo-hydrolase [Candidatus Poribacteria bacterium]
MKYNIRPLPNGRCVIAGNYAFYRGNPDERYTYMLFLWLIEGGERPMLVDAGLKNVDEMNSGAAHVLAEPITQTPEQTAVAQLDKYGYKPKDIGYVFITHLHFDHIDQLDIYKNAKIVVSKRGLEAATANPGWVGSWAPGKTLRGLTQNWKERVIALDDKTVLPGVEVIWIGGHTPCSQAVCVQTEAGEAIMTGDTVSLLANIEKQIPVGVYDDLEEVKRAMKKLKERNAIILPSHDPGIFDRFPEGVIG